MLYGNLPLGYLNARTNNVEPVSHPQVYSVPSQIARTPPKYNDC